MEDNKRQTGRTINALMDLFLKVRFTNVDGIYVVLSNDMGRGVMTWLLNLISEDQVSSTNSIHNVIVFHNMKKIAFLTPQQLESVRGIIDGAVIVYDHTVQKSKSPVIINRLDLIEE